MTVCPICQTENDDLGKECILCGAPLPEPEVQAAPKTSSPLSTGEVSAFQQRAAGDDVVQDILGTLPTSGSGANTPPPDPLLSTQNINLSGGGVPDMSHVVSPNEVQQTTRPPEQTVPASVPGAMPTPEIPPSGTLCLVVYFQRKPAFYLPVTYDELLIGRTDPASNAYPDLDVTPYDTELAISRKHCYLYREGNEYYIYPISNSGTQVNQEMIDIGTKRRLREGDVIILSGRLAIRFIRIP